MPKKPDGWIRRTADMREYARAWRAANADKCKKYEQDREVRRRARMANDPEYREKELERDRVRDRLRYRRKVMEKFGTNDDRMIEAEREKRKKIKSSSLKLEMLASQKFECAACSKLLVDGFEVDHIIPIARGGTNDRSNLQLLCPTCNRSKSDKIVWHDKCLVAKLDGDA